jgi:hypothetical protein
MRFVIFVIDSRSRSAQGDEIAAIDAFNDDLRVRGEFVLAVGLADPGAAVVVDARGDASEIRSGSLFGGDEFFSGLWIIDVGSLEIAHERAMQGSRACNRRVELRPLL